MKLDELKRCTKLVGGYRSTIKKQEAIDVILQRQHKHNPILIKDETGNYIKNPTLNIFDYNGWNQY